MWTIELERFAPQPDGPYHDSRGCGIPDWVGLSDQLFKAARSFALRESSSTQWPELVTTNAESSAFTAPHNLDAHWLWYDGDELTVHEFRIAFAMRLGIVPQRWRCRGKCECGQFINTDEDQITHTLKCDRFTTSTPGEAASKARAARDASMSHGP